MADDPISGMVFKMMQQSGMEPEEKLRAFPMKEAQREMLTAVLKHAVTPREFRPGDLVHYAGGWGPFNKRARSGLEHMFFRYLDMSSHEDQKRIADADDIEFQTLPTIDCLIFGYDGEGVRFNLSCSALLSPGPVPDQADD